MSARCLPTASCSLWAAPRRSLQVAAEWWVNHLRRELSIIQLFTGQFKSRLCCLNCGESARYARRTTLCRSPPCHRRPPRAHATVGAESARYEPFTMLQLPLPEPEHRYIYTTLFFRRNCRRPVHLSVQVAKVRQLDMPAKPLLSFHVSLHRRMQASSMLQQALPLFDLEPVEPRKGSLTSLFPQMTWFVFAFSVLCWVIAWSQ